MASPLPSQAVSDTLSYFDRFDFPLTSDELWYWQHGMSYSKSRITDIYLDLPRNPKLISLRRLREKYSQKKLAIAKRVGDQLTWIPTILAVFITGSLAMDNTSRHDDIDLMVVTTPHALWLTRLLVVSFITLRGWRRPPSLPEHSSPRVSDKICDNLYLDSNHLALPNRSLYLAHEILQAKPLWDRSNIHHQLLLKNSWVQEYLPVAFRETLKKLHSRPPTSNLQLVTTLLFLTNLLLFFVQYLYMKPKITTEKVGLGFAFFHPHPPHSRQ